MVGRIILAFLVAQVAFAGVVYTYDSAGRLTQANYGTAGVVTYSYDSVGRLVSRQVQGSVTTAITIQTVPTGLQFSVDNTALQTAPQTVNLTQGTHTIAVAPTQPGPVGTQYVFTSWSGGGTAAMDMITVTGTAATYMASFVTQYQLNVSASPVAGGAVTPASGSFYNSGVAVPVSATANGGYLFTGWTGSVSNSSSAATSVTMSGPQTIVANFSAQSSVSITEYSVPTAASAGITAITSGPDGALWFTEAGVSAIGRITTAGEYTQYSLGTVSLPWGITTGPDGALWFTDFADKIWRMTTGGALAQYPVPTSGSWPYTITPGPDGALWFTEFNASKIGRITTAGVITEYPVPTALSYPNSIIAGPDGALWFTEEQGSKIGRITTAGSITEYPIPSTGPIGITVGPDAALWFTEAGGDRIGRITTSGVATDYPVPTASSQPWGISSGSDGALWFTEYDGNNVGRITTIGAVTEYAIPTAGSESQGIVAGSDAALWFIETATNKIRRVGLSRADAFFTGQISLGSGVEYLQFPDGTLFGYYTFVASTIFYHYDMGYEAFVPGSASDVYLYDFASGHWWYTSSTLFPDLYDFTLKSWLYYFPDTKNAGHYTTGPRYFVNLTTGQIFTM
jgi:virginiamycin B lyase